MLFEKIIFKKGEENNGENVKATGKSGKINVKLKLKGLKQM
jgi:hypothetical protein